MTKQDILNMNTTKEIMETFMTHRELWDEEVNEHLKAVARKKLIERFGSADVTYTPPRKKKD